MTEEREITATHLRANLGAVLDSVLSGTTVRVTRNRRPLVVLVPPQRYDQFTEESPMQHFTAWLTTTRSALDQDRMDVVVLEDEEISETDSGEIVWGTKNDGGAVFSGITDVSALTGDHKTGMESAQNMLEDSGWRTVGDWRPVDTGYTVTVEEIA